MVQGPCGEGPWGAYGEGVTGRGHMEQHTVQPAVPEKASLGGKLYHVTTSLKPQMLSLMAEKKNPKRNKNSPLKSLIWAIAIFIASSEWYFLSAYLI